MLLFSKISKKAMIFGGIRPLEIGIIILIVILLFGASKRRQRARM